MTATEPAVRYVRLPDRRDEALEPDGSIRAPWTDLLTRYAQLGTVSLGRRQLEIDRLLEQDGVVYNAPGTGRGQAVRWRVDAVPLILDQQDAAFLERGLSQRARLLDLVLTDLYGERRLIGARRIPAEMILADPNFRREADGIRHPGPHQLTLAAIDLVRDPNGEWRAIGQRTQAPSGIAYAIENRRALSRIFPSIHRDAAVSRLAPFLRSLRSALRAVAPPGVEDPSIVVLSPGSHSETSFDHAAIAAQLGFPLVEGQDLVVRGGRVWLDTMAGEVAVHVILRRIDTEFCDPLELRPDSTLGTPGLVDAARAGTVSIVNGLGSGVLENAGLASILPDLCRELLDEDLLLPGPMTWWCGDPAGRSHVLAHLGSLLIRPLSRSGTEHTVDTRRLTHSQLADLRERVEHDPARWVGQERLVTSTAPSYVTGSLQPRPFVLRSFAVAGPEGYQVLAGGLARTPALDNDDLIAGRVGVVAKDVWVTGAALEAETDFWLQSSSRLDQRRLATAPRAAEQLFWLGRHAERAEATIRLVREVGRRVDDFSGVGAGPGQVAVESLLDAIAELTGVDRPPLTNSTSAASSWLATFVTDQERLGTIGHAIDRMMANVEGVRDQLSLDTFLILGSARRAIERPTGDADDDTLTAVLDQVLQILVAFAGLVSESMVRDQGWYFIDAGRRLERAERTASLITATMGRERTAPVESLLVESALTVGESIITYRRRHRSRAQVSTMVDLLVADIDNPRSITFQVSRLAADLDALQASVPTRDLLERTQRLMVELEAFDAFEATRIDESGRRSELDSFLTHLRLTLRELSDDLAEIAFHRQPGQHTLRTPVHTPVGRPQRRSS